MASTISEIVTAFGDVVAKFATAPLSYIVGIMIVGAAVGMVGSLFGRRGGRRR